ncbi:MAG: hypothetical protein C4334_11880 [Pyrinomonas sp.]
MIGLVSSFLDKVGVSFVRRAIRGPLNGERSLAMSEAVESASLSPLSTRQRSRAAGRIGREANAEAFVPSSLVEKQSEPFYREAHRRSLRAFGKRSKLTSIPPMWLNFKDFQRDAKTR